MTLHPMRPATALLALSGLWLAALPAAHAGEAYVNVGFPGVMAGYAQAVTDLVTLRGDFATMGSRGQDGVEEGIEYKGTFKAGKKHGKGTFNWTDGSYYEGAWDAGVQQGHGKYVDAQNVIHEGEFLKGKKIKGTH